MKRYWVVGGEYSDTKFQTIAEGKVEERHGPFRRYLDARREWQGRTMSTIDDAHHRYVITVESEARTPKPPKPGAPGKPTKA